MGNRKSCIHHTPAGYSKISSIRISTIENKKSLEIDQKIYKEAGDASHHVRVLLLGAGESGKSTVVKQMKVRNINTYIYYINLVCLILINLLF